MADVGIKISAFDNTKAAFDSVGRGLGTIQSGAAGVAGALASIGVGISIGGFVAMTKQIIDGLDAMNDLKDATGASIENISALEDVARRTGSSFDTVSTSLIKLNQGLNNAKPGSDTEAALKAIGLSVKDLKQLDPAEAFRQIAVGLSGFADDGNKARIVQELFGKSLKEVAPLLKDLAEAGQLVATVTTQQAEEAEKFNKQIFAMQANIGNAARTMTSEFLPTLNAMTAELLKADTAGGSFSKTLGETLATGLEYAVRVGAGAAFVFKTIGREIGGVVAGLDALGSGGGVFSKEGRAGWSAVFDARAEDFARDVKSYNDLVNSVAGAKSAPPESISSGGGKPSIGDLPDQAAIKAAAAAAAKSLAEYNRELEKQSKLIAESAGLTGSFAEDWDRLTKIYEKGSYNLDQLTEAQAKLLAGQPGIKAYNDAAVEAAEAIEKARVSAADARQKYNAGLDSDLAKLQDESAAMQDYVDRLGLSKEAIAELDAKRLESQAVTQDLIVLKKIEQGLDEDQYEIYVKLAAELRSQAALKRTAAGKESTLEAGKESAKATFDEFKRGWEETDRIAREAFTGWAENGVSMADAIGKSLKKALLSAIYEATLKPIAFQLYTSIAGGGGSAMSAMGAAGNVGSAANGVGMLGSVGSAFGAFGTGASYGATSLFANGFGATMSAGSSMLGAGSTAAGLGTMAGAIAPYLLGAIALKSLTDYKVEAKGHALVATIGSTGVTSRGGDVATRADFTQTGGFLGGGTTQNSDWGRADKGVADYINANVTAITAANKAYGETLGLTSTAIDGFTKNLDITITGLDAAGQKAAIDAELVKFAAEQSAAAYGTAIAAFAKDGEAASATVARLATDLTSVNTAFEALGFGLYDVSVAGASAASGLVEAMGGLQNFQAQTTSYFKNFYSEEEQRAQTIKNINAATAGSTLDAATATRESFRALVEAQDLTTDGGRKTYAALLNVSGAFSELVGTSEASAAGLKGLSKTLADTATSAQRAASNLMSKMADDFQRSIGLKSVDIANGIDRLFAHNAETMQMFKEATSDNTKALKAQYFADGGTSYSMDTTPDQAAKNWTLMQASVQSQSSDLAAWVARRQSIYAPSAQQNIGYSGEQSSGGGGQQKEDPTQADGYAAAKALTEANTLAAEAAKAAAAALATFQSALASLTDTNINLQAKMLELKGDTEGAYALTRAKDLSKITAGFTPEQAAQLTGQYDANKLLSDQIDELTKSQTLAAKATSDAANAADQIKNAWKSIGDSLLKEVDRIRGVIAATSADSYAALESRFAIATAQARAGDQTAAGNLTNYSSQLSAAATDNAGSRNELVLMQAKIAQSLSETALVIGSTPGIIMPFTPQAQTQSTEKLESAITSLQAKITSLESALSSIQSNTQRTAVATETLVEIAP